MRKVGFTNSVLQSGTSGTPTGGCHPGLLKTDGAGIKSSPITNAPKRQQRHSVENTMLTEVITIYEKLKKGRDNFSSYHSTSSSGNPTRLVERQVSHPVFDIDPSPEIHSVCMLDFNKYQNFQPSKYVYFSEKTNVLQSKYLSTLSPSFSNLLKEKNYWLNIFNPDEEDYALLFNSFGVHDLTIMDIRERNTDEKLEAFEHYTFLSLRLMRENQRDVLGSAEDVDFNILLFKDFVITIHEKKWPSITDILGFLNLLTMYSSGTQLSPEWILFSIFIELNQDAKYFLNSIEPEINKIRIGSKSVDIMRRNYDMELQVYSIARFIKPKIRLLRQIKVKCSKRISLVVMRLLGDILTELKEQSKDVRQFNHILERSQDTFLAIVTSDNSKESNEITTVMKKLSEIALVLLPIQIIGGFMGTNVQIPFQNSAYPDTQYFWFMVLFSALVGLVFFLLRRKILG